MKQIVLLATGTLLSCSIAVSAQQDGSWRMHDGMGWGWGGMWLGPLFMLAALAILVGIVVFLARWLGGDRAAAPKAPRTARDLLDERYARDEIDREEYLRRRQDLAD
jgi:putative membrane protein